MPQSLSLSTDDFLRLREEDKYYIDKSLFIKEFLDYNTEATLIIRPRRFGKTLNMTMLREFLDITKDSRHIFEGLKIMETEHASKLNQIPVLFFSFKNCEADTLNGILWVLSLELLKEYERYFLQFSGLGDSKVSLLERFHSMYRYLKELSHAYSGQYQATPQVNPDYLKISLEILIQGVAEWFGIKPIVLIDEYDQPFLSAHKHGFREGFSEIYAGILTRAFKGNPHLKQVLMTGIQRVAKESIFSKLDHFLVYTVVDDKYSAQFGLTLKETGQALKDFGMELTDEVKSYYDGYRFGSQEIYNPWSIFSYIDEKILKSYWINTSTNLLIRESILNSERMFKRQFEQLIEKGTTTVYANFEAAFIELRNTSTLWGLLLNAGYVTIVQRFNEERLKLRIPNQETLKEFRSIVALYSKDCDLVFELISNP